MVRRIPRETDERLVKVTSRAASKRKRPAPGAGYAERIDAIVPTSDHRTEVVFSNPYGDVPLSRLAPNAVRLLAQHARDQIYVHGDGLVHVVQVDEAEAVRGIRRSKAPRILRLPDAVLRERLDAVARWMKQSRKNNGEVVAIEKWCPREVVDAVLHRGEWPGIRGLLGVTTAPVLRPDGTVLDAPGYDAATALLYVPDRDHPPVPTAPNEADVREAVRTLVDPFDEFPLETPGDRAALLAYMLALVARAAIDGPVPMTLAQASEPGSGKTLIMEAATTAVTGFGPDTLMAPGGRASDADAEWRKRIATQAMEAPRAVLIDNILDGSTLNIPALSAALTADELAERLLGVNRMMRVPHRIVWAATGNNVTLAADLARRSLSVLIDPACEDPHLRGGFRIRDLLGHVRAQHPQLLHAALVILRGFVVAGRPGHGGPALGMFEAWDALARAAVIWATELAGWRADPLDTQERLRTASPDKLNLGALLQAWYAELGERAVQASEVRRRANCGGAEALYGALTAACPRNRDDLPSTVALGRYLGRHAGRVVGGLRIVEAGTTSGTRLWAVRAPTSKRV